jgi:tetratricopeptide (TPR) repeat protein
MSVSRKLLLCVFLLLAGGVFVRAAAMEDANASFNAGDFSKAAIAYESLIAKNGATASTLYNLGNSRFRLKEYGPAILAYERASLLSPRDPDVRANLKLARQAAASYDESETHPWWQSVLLALSLHEWSWVVIIGAMLPALATLAWGLAGFSRPWLKRSAIAALVVGILVGSLGSFALWHRRDERNLAIITAAEPTLRLSPFPEAASAGSPGTGRIVRLGDRSNGWVHVSVSGSTLSGWLPEKDAPPLMPQGS